MNKLIISKTPNTPSVDFDPVSGKFSLEGRAIPENPGEFFDNIVNWLGDYFAHPAPITILDVNLEYVNSGSSKYLLGVFRKFKEAYSDNKEVEIRWHFEEDDEAIEGLGEHYRTVMNVPFKMIEYI